MIEIFRGDDVTIRVTVKEKDRTTLANLAGAEALFGYYSKGTTTPIAKPCTVDVENSKLIVELDHTETALMLFDYVCVMKLKDSNSDYHTVWADTVRVKPTYMTDFPYPSV